MPIAVDERTGDLVDGTLTLKGGGTISCRYYPDRISGRMLKKILTMGSLLDGSSDDETTDKSSKGLAMTKACDEAADFIVRIVERWDLLLTRKPEPKKCPLDVDTIADFGLSFLFEILIALVEQVKMGEATGMQSSTPSQRTTSSRSSGSSSRSAAASRKSSSTSKSRATSASRQTGSKTSR